MEREIASKVLVLLRCAASDIERAHQLLRPTLSGEERDEFTRLAGIVLAQIGFDLSGPVVKRHPDLIAEGDL